MFVADGASISDLIINVVLLKVVGDAKEVGLILDIARQGKSLLSYYRIAVEDRSLPGRHTYICDAGVSYFPPSARHVLRSSNEKSEGQKPRERADSLMSVLGT